MMVLHSPTQMTRKVIDSLHVESMVLADEARSYFDGAGLADRSDLDPVTRVIFSCEALNVTTRLMHCVAWLLSHRARLATQGEVEELDAALGDAAASDRIAIACLPEEALRIIAASEDIYRRISALNAKMHERPTAAFNPAHQLLRQIETRF